MKKPYFYLSLEELVASKLCPTAPVGMLTDSSWEEGQEWRFYTGTAKVVSLQAALHTLFRTIPPSNTLPSLKHQQTDKSSGLREMLFQLHWLTRRHECNQSELHSASLGEVQVTAGEVKRNIWLRSPAQIYTRYRLDTTSSSPASWSSAKIITPTQSWKGRWKMLPRASFTPQYVFPRHYQEAN